MGDFDGKVVVITGAAGGLGSTVTRRFAAESAALALWEFSVERAETLVGQLDESVNAFAAMVDATKPESVDAAITRTLNTYGQIDVLLHIAGGFAMPGPVHEGHIDTWHKMIALNATATYITCGKVAAAMIEKGVQGSIAAILARPAAHGGGANGAAYAASKAAALRVIESMAKELAPHHIRVNGLSPSIIDTPGNRSAMGDANVDKWVTPDEIAETLMFLTSQRGSAITGANIDVFKWS